MARTTTHMRRSTATRGDGAGVAPRRLEDADLERELRHMYDTRAETFFDGTRKALRTHTKRMLDLEAEYRRRFPEDTKPDPARTREGSRRREREDAGAGSSRAATTRTSPRSSRSTPTPRRSSKTGARASKAGSTAGRARAR